MKAALVNVNGNIVPPETAAVSVFDRGFLFGDGVYETGRSFDRSCLYFDEHLKRLRISAGKLQIPVPWDDGELKRRLYETARRFGKPDIYYRMIVTRGLVSEVGLGSQTDTGPALVIIVQELPAELDEKKAKGVSLLTSRVIRNPVHALDPNIKTSNYLNSLLALQDVRSRGGEDAVLCDSHGRVTEGTTFSVFAVTREGKLITPSLEVGILDSITRRHVIELAARDRRVEEGFFTLGEMQSCPEVFIASSVRGIIPVRLWDGHELEVPGPATKKLQESLAEAVKCYAASHDRF